MARPAVSQAAEELYAALDPAWTTGDEERDWSTLRFCDVLCAGTLETVHGLVTDSAAGPGWSLLFDPDLVPAPWLDWLAQPAGATLRPDMSVEQKRDAIRKPEAFGRGTIPAIEQVAKRRLTGTKAVVVTERYTGNAWRMLIETLAAETPDPEATKAEIIAEQKPIGILLFFNERADWTWEELVTEEATWEDVLDDYPTWFDLRTHEP